MTDNQLTLIEGGRDVEQFDPERFRLTQAALDYSIEHAKRIKDWPKLETAVDDKIEEAHKFVAWWNATVRDAGQPQKNSPRTRLIPCGEAEDLTGMKHQRVSDLGRRLRDPDKFRLQLLGAEYQAACLAALDNVRGTTGTGENEWFTPAEYIELARAVLGEIDLDPATHVKAQEIVCAKEFFTKDDDGLTREWHGNVWLNPPYAQPFIAQFADKMLEEWSAQRVTAAIMLTHNYTDTVWFQKLAGAANAICFTRGRVKFYEPDGTIAAPTQGQAFFYFGSFVKIFADKFGSIGFAVVPWR